MEIYFKKEVKLAKKDLRCLDVDGDIIVVGTMDKRVLILKCIEGEY